MSSHNFHLFNANIDIPNDFKLKIVRAHLLNEIICFFRLTQVKFRKKLLAFHEKWSSKMKKARKHLLDFARAFKLYSHSMASNVPQNNVVQSNLNFTNKNRFP